MRLGTTQNYRLTGMMHNVWSGACAGAAADHVAGSCVREPLPVIAVA